jgi:acetyl-CoA carboxylase carboxyltransferase component
MSWEDEIQELQRRRELAEKLGGDEAIERQHKAGKLTARERIEKLLDPDTFQEMGTLTGRAEYDEDGNFVTITPSNAIIGTGRIDGRKVVVSADDFTIRGGSSESTISDKWVFAERLAFEMRMPLIRLVDTAGGSVRLLEQQQQTKIPGYPTWPLSRLMGAVPVIGVALGACAGLGAIKVVVTHFSVMVRETSQVFAAGPPVVKQGLDQQVHKNDLGGYKVHARHSGVVNNEAVDEADALGQVRRFLSYLPHNVWEIPGRGPSDDDPTRTEESLLSAVPEDRRKGYNARKILEAVLDRDSIFEIGRRNGTSSISCLARLNGYPVGVMANDPFHAAGAMTRTSAQKVEKFVDLCDTFHIPIVNFVDQPGVMTGVEAERGGTLTAALRALMAIEQSETPWVSIIVRRVFGVAGGAHGRKHGIDGSSVNLRYAWPSARWGSIPIEGGVAAAFRREIDAAPDPQARRAELEAYYGRFASPFRSAERFSILEIIDPRQTRPLLCDWVEDAYELIKTQAGPKLRTMRC